MKAKKKMSMYMGGGKMYGKNGTKVMSATGETEKPIKGSRLSEITVTAKRPNRKGNARLTEEGMKYRNSNQAKQDYINAAAKAGSTSSKGMTMGVARKLLDMGFNEWQGKHMEKKGMKIRIDPRTGEDL